MKQSIMVKNIFLETAYNASIAQKYQSVTQKHCPGINHKKLVLLPEEGA